jgi:hypothetical protein
MEVDDARGTFALSPQNPTVAGVVRSACARIVAVDTRVGTLIFGIDLICRRAAAHNTLLRAFTGAISCAIFPDD